MEPAKHFFRVEDAERYGILAAILLENIRFWISRNKIAKTGFSNGNYWTYRTVKAYSEQFPYATPKQIRTALHNLVAKGVLVKGCHSKHPWDRTSWYRFADEDSQVLDRNDLAHRMGAKKLHQTEMAARTGLRPLSMPPAAKRQPLANSAGA